jgi:hypothetical protein
LANEAPGLYCLAIAAYPALLLPFDTPFVVWAKQLAHVTMRELFVIVQ